MFKRNRDHTHTRAGVPEDRMPLARGGVSLGAILTGVVVAFGALTLLLALAGGILAATGGIDDIENVSGSEAIDAGIAAGVVLLIVWFLAYMWGGYTAGRMGRGAGFLNGLLVPILAILLLVAVGAIAAGLGAEAELNNPLDTIRLPVSENNLLEIGTGAGIAVLVAMFLGAILGGMLGARWHTKLERRVAEQHAVHETHDRRHDEDDARALEERRRLSERADERRQTAVAPAAAPPPPGQTTTSNEPVVTKHGTATGAQSTTPRTAPPPSGQTTSEKPSIKDRLTGKG
ncbi:MAG: YrzE family protein [Actinomycetota bacterium]